MPLRFDISCTNFDHFFAAQSAGMGENQKDLLPKELNYKLFKKGGKQTSTSTNRLSFLAKVFILIKALRKRVIILVEDENGMNEEQYFKHRKLIPKKSVTVETATKIVSEVTFILCNKEIIDTYSYMNLINTSNQYNYLTKGKNSGNNKTTESVKQWNYIARFVSYYEKNRKTIALKTQINMSEWLVLIHLYHGNEVVSSSIYKDWYRYSFNSSKTKIKVAFGTLQEKGYIEKIGNTSTTKLKITSIGKSLTSELLSKYVVNC